MIDWIVLAVAFAAIATGLLVALRARRRPPQRPNPYRTRAPIVLAHGLAGFDSIQLGQAEYHYFRGVAQHLRSLGASVFVPAVSPLASVAERAKQLHDHLRAIDGPINIVAHSMGGIDARYAVARLGLHKKVVSLVTVGTPHRGTPIADLVSGVLDEGLKLKVVLRSFGLDLGALSDLRTDRMREFNALVTDVRRVDYACYVASVPDVVSLNPLLAPTYLYLQRAAGKNDGMVPCESQRWGQVLGEIAADHWAQIGWSKGFDAPAFYAALVAEMRAQGW